ncbi:MAG: 2-oxoglutarate dehydrogenase E1 component [Bradymonadaceae bacterium]
MTKTPDPDDSSDRPRTELSGWNRAYIETLFERYKQDPDAVDSSWKAFFDRYLDTDRPASRAPAFERRSIFESDGAPAPTTAPARSTGPEPVPEDEIEGGFVEPLDRSQAFASRVQSLIHAYRLHGHLVADIDPLGRDRPRSHEQPRLSEDGRMDPELDPAAHGISEDDLDARVYCEGLFPESREATLREVVDRMSDLYCGPVGVEYQNIPVTRRRDWLREQIEEANYAPIDGAEQKRSILRQLIETEGFEQFLHQKYIGAKRFGITGGDTLIPMLDVLFDELGRREAEEVVIGMAHRGRLNVLHNIMEKPAELMFSEFENDPEPEVFFGSSDVKYHMGYSSDYQTASGDELHLSLCFNPSHLEFVNPVALGRARAKQTRKGLPEARRSTVPLLLHGDAAFAGEGIVQETLNLARLDGFTVGGTIHVVINNQLGFTTEPDDGRSTTYATDVAQMLEVPIFHVNAWDPEACIRVVKLAARYRQRFQEDVIIDFVCYRKHGHNEGDEPRFTQPEMYDRIDDKPPLYESYAAQLVEEGIVDEDEVQQRWDEQWEAFNDIYDEIHESPRIPEIDSLDGLWQPYEGGVVDGIGDIDTTVDRERLETLGRELAEVPDDFTPHRTLSRLLDQREEMAAGERPINWPFAEALASASVITEGHPFRLSGQDSIRGTFSHRHAALFDNETGEPYWPARNLSDASAPYEVYNSPLTEAGVLGFEYGFSMDYPDGLTLWEAQFGDFANGGQVIVDQFISSAEDKWDRLSGLVMLLPHAYEGQGPDHSSARLERYLQLCAEHNMFVCNLTEPAQYFHVLRRQLHADVRKPLVIMTPKSLLRHEDATSTLDELADGEFRRIIPEQRESIDPNQVRRVLLCSGKVYYDLLDHAREHEIDDVAIVRVEQLYPLDQEALKAAVEPFDAREDLVWVQEEPRNMGPWFYMYPELRGLFDEEPLYAGRVPSASPATGSKDSHKIEQKKLLERAFEAVITGDHFGLSRPADPD